MTSVPSRPRGKTGEMTGNSIFELIQQKEHFYTTINTLNLFEHKGKSPIANTCQCLMIIFKSVSKQKDSKRHTKIL